MNLNEATILDRLKDGSDELTIRRSLDIRESSWHELISLGEFDVPEYQRNYSWESSETGNGKERDEFWRTLEDRFGSLKQVPSYIVNPEEECPEDSAAGLYMGAVYISKSADSQYDVVDGQQRLVSFQLLIGAILERIDAIDAQIEKEGEGGEFLDLKQDIENCKEDLKHAYNDGIASLALNEEDEEFFKMLAAQPTHPSRIKEIIGYLKNHIQTDEDVDGQNKPRAITGENLVEYINANPVGNHNDIRTNSRGSEDLQGPHENKLDIETINSKVQEEIEDESKNDGEILSDHIRFFESHAKLLNCYLESYGFVDKIKQKYGENTLKKEANTLVNLAYFVLHAITVSVIEITNSSTDVGLEIFESINDRGKELNDVDKIRARIKYVLDEGADSGVMSNWRETLDRFGGDKSQIQNMLKYYVGATDDNVDDVTEADSALMEVFSDYSEDYEERLDNRENAKELVQDIHEFSKYYYHICDNDMTENSRIHMENQIEIDKYRVWINKFIQRLNSLGFTQWFVLGPRMCQKIDKCDEEDITDDSKGEFLVNVFDAIEVVAIRQSMSDKSGEATEGIHTAAVQSLPDPEADAEAEDYDSSKIVSEMAENLINKTPNLFGSGLISNITEQKAWHSYSNSTISKELLTRIVDMDRGEGPYDGILFDEDDDLTIEHVLPDTPISNAIKSERDTDIDVHEWLRVFFKLDEPGTEPESERPRITQDISEYILDAGVLTTNQNSFEKATQFISRLESNGISEFSSERFQTALNEIDSADEGTADNQIVEAALELESIDSSGDIKQKITTVKRVLDMDQYETHKSAEETSRLIEEINERFVDDIANLFFLSYSDNPVASNNLLSEKLSVLSDDDYQSIVVNQFFQPEGKIVDISSELTNEELTEFDGNETEISDDMAEHVDNAWNYDALFKRKRNLIKTIVSHLRFKIDPDHQRYGKNEFEFGGETLEEKIETEVERDRDRRLQRDPF